MATTGKLPKLGFNAGAIGYVVRFGFGLSNAAAGTGQTAAFSAYGLAQQSFAAYGQAQQSLAGYGHARQSLAGYGQARQSLSAYGQAQQSFDAEVL